MRLLVLKPRHSKKTYYHLTISKKPIGVKMKKLILAASIFSLMPFMANAQNSAPMALPIVDTIPAAKDIKFNGTISLNVDVTNIDQAIFKINETIPVQAAGHMVLLFPKWLPGNHGPRGGIDKLAGLKIYANGKLLEWTRDKVDVYAFHIDVPAGVNEIKAEFQYLSPTDKSQGRMEVTNELMSLQTNSISLYPAGYYVRNIPIAMSVTLPKGWKAATALRPASTNGDTINYQTVPYDVFIDSPILAGLYSKSIPLSDKVTLDIFADAPKYLEYKPEQMAPHKKLVEQAVKTFGAQHYDHYNFLFSLSDNLGGIGLEHHRSSENGVAAGYFTDWENSLGSRNLLPHEYSHSWDGKYRRGADLWTPDYRTPMQNSLLWVYEGQTQFWGYVLGARSGLYSKDQTLEAYAAIAAELDVRKGREWRDLLDTTNDPVISARSPKAWVSYQRSEDYYNEGMLVWLEVDAKIRELSGGKKSIDDFAKAFYGMRDGDYGELTYTIEDVSKTLDGVVKNDWAKLLNSRLREHEAGAPLGGFNASGYKLIYTDKPNAYIKDIEGSRKFINLLYSLGMSVNTDGAISQVLWDGVAFKNMLAVGDKVIAINGKPFAKDVIIEEVKAAKGTKEPIQFIIQAGTKYKIVNIDYHDGLKYPHFEKTGTNDGAIDKLLKPLD